MPKVYKRQRRNYAFIPAQKHEDWGLDDPTDKSDSEFINLIQQIEAKVNQMRLN